MTDPAPSDLYSHVDLVGPGTISLFFQGLLSGVVISQFSTFLDRVERESRVLVVLAVFVTIVALYATLLY